MANLYDRDPFHNVRPCPTAWLVLGIPRSRKGKSGKQMLPLILHILSCKLDSQLQGSHTDDADWKRSSVCNSLSVDTELRKAMSNLPSHFAVDFDNPDRPPTDAKARVAYWEKIIINLSGQSRIMRLHRPWLSRGYRDKKYVQFLLRPFFYGAF